MSSSRRAGTGFARGAPLLAFIVLIILLSQYTAYGGIESATYESVITVGVSGDIAVKAISSTYQIQTMVGQALIGSLSIGSQDAGRDLQCGFLYVIEPPAVPVQQEYEIYDIRAFSHSKTSEIFSKTWQTYNDPYFIWKMKLFYPDVLILGYSVALDQEPDDTVDTVETYYDGFLVTPIADGKHTFYIKAQTTGEIWGEYSTFEFWVDTKEPTVDNLNPESGSIIADNMPVISLSLLDVYSGVDPDSIKLYIDGDPFSFEYKESLLSCMTKDELPDGSRIARIQAKDFAGNLLDMAWGFTVDANFPIGSILINGSDESTSYARVRLNLEATDETTLITEMIISNDGIFDDEKWESFQSLRTDWVLDDPQKVGKKTVYCMFKDEAGNISSVYKDEITLLNPAIDTIITTGPLSPTKDNKAQFKYQATFDDAVFSYKLDDAEWSAWASTASVNFTDLAVGNHIFSVKAAKDLNADKLISEEEEDPLPAQWVWVITTEEEIERKEKILYWRTE